MVVTKLLMQGRGKWISATTWGHELPDNANTLSGQLIWSWQPRWRPEQVGSSDSRQPPAALREASGHRESTSGSWKNDKSNLDVCQRLLHKLQVWPSFAMFALRVAVLSLPFRSAAAEIMTNYFRGSFSHWKTVYRLPKRAFTTCLWTCSAEFFPTFLLLLIAFELW